MKKVIVSLALLGSLISTSAMAWGPREQGILAGVAGLWVYQQLDRAGRQPQAVYVQPAPVYVQPQTVYVQPPVYALPPQQYCELRSEVVNGQIIQGNFCYYR
jgi:hypothetical protein